MGNDISSVIKEAESNRQTMYVLTYGVGDDKINCGVFDKEGLSRIQGLLESDEMYATEEFVLNRSNEYLQVDFSVTFDIDADGKPTGFSTTYDKDVIRGNVGLYEFILVHPVKSPTLTYQTFLPMETSQDTIDQLFKSFTDSISAVKFSIQLYSDYGIDWFKHVIARIDRIYKVWYIEKNIPHDQVSE